MSTTIAPLPDSLTGWSAEQVTQAIDERHGRVESLIEKFGDDFTRATAVDVAEIKQLNDDLDRLKSAPLRPRGFFPRGGGRRQTVGDTVFNALKLKAAFDGTSGGTASPSFFDPDLREMPNRRLFLRELIPMVPVTSDKVDFVKQSVNTHAAAAVARGAQKPKSTYTIKRETATIQTIAHVSEAIDRALLADYEQAVNFINDVLVIGVLLEEEDQILNGDGISPNLTGILNTAGISTQAKGADPHFDAIFKAMTKLRLDNFEPDGIVLHPNDWQEIRLTRTADGVYIQGSPVERGQERLFDKPVVVSPLIAEGTGLVGAFGAGATVYDREQARVTFTESGLGDSAGQELFDRNQVRFRGESRIGLGVAFPKSFCSVTGI